MAYLNLQQLLDLNFAHLGNDVLISDKASVYNPESISIGDNSRIDDFCGISGNLSIGRTVHITPQCLLAGGDINPGLVINDFATLAYGVKVFTQSDDYHGYSMTNSTVPKVFKNELKASVVIGRHAIIGAGCIVLPGVYISDGTSIGANSLVNKSTKPWSIYFGSPARYSAPRSKDLLTLEAQYLNE